MQTMTSANYLPAGCKHVKLNLTNAYRTTATHLVPGDDVRVRLEIHGTRATFAPTQAPKNSVWARVDRVERTATGVRVWFDFNGARCIPAAAHTSVTRKERPEEYSARLMLAEQERAAAVKASEAELAAAMKARQEEIIAEQERAEQEVARTTRLLECGHAHATPLEAASCGTQARLANVQAGGTWSDPAARPVSVHDFKPDFTGMCQKVVDRPSGIPTICGEPIKSAIHDPAAYAEYATELGAALAEWSGRKASGRYIPGKAPSAPVGLVIPVEEQTSDMSIRRGVQVWHPDYAGTVWVVRFTHGLGSDLVADLIHFGTGDQLRDVKVTDLTPVIHLPEAAIPFNPAGTAQTAAAVATAASIAAGTAAAIPTQRQPMLQTDMRARAMKAEAKLAEVEASLRGMLQEAKEARHHANRLGSFDREAYAQADTRVAVLEEALGYFI